MTEARKFALTACLLWVLVVSMVAWGTDVRMVAVGALYSVGAVAFLPFLVIVAGVALLIFSGIVSGLAEADVPTDGGGAGVIRGGLRLIRPYYRLVFVRKHPLILGLGAGCILGAATLALLIAVVVAPKEVETGEVLSRAALELEEQWTEEVGFPAASQGMLLQSTLDPSGSNEAVEDGFGQPLQYSVEQNGSLSVLELRSLGFDGELSSDDLCTRRETSQMSQLSTSLIAAFNHQLEAAFGVESTFGESVEAIIEMRCEDPAG